MMNTEGAILTFDSRKLEGTATDGTYTWYFNKHIVKGDPKTFQIGDRVKLTIDMRQCELTRIENMRKTDNPKHDSIVLKLNQLAYLLNITDDALSSVGDPSDKSTGSHVARLLVKDLKIVLGELREQVLT